MPRKAVGILLAGTSPLDHIVFGQFARPFTASQVAFTQEVSDDFDALVAGTATSPRCARALTTFLERGGRVLFFGNVPEELARMAGLRRLAQDPRRRLSGATIEKEGARVSQCVLRYRENNPFSPWLPWSERTLWRFDFESSWNIYGFGKILLEEDPWSISGYYEAPGAEVLAAVSDGANSLPFMTLRRVGAGAILWVNRDAGLPDSIETSALVHFLCSWEPTPRSPAFVSPIPPGFQAAATFRLDCDEAIDSADGLLQDYFDAGIRPSLAVTTREIRSDPLRVYLRDFARRGGAVLSHSVDHAPNWGGSYETAAAQGRESRRILEEVTERPVHNAVSPFHQNPPQAIAALRDHGYCGLATGILDSAPQALQGWPGYYSGPNGPLAIALHEQMGMLHGDIVRAHGGLRHYKASFAAHARAGVPFGWLDHPMSGYDYGWGTPQRQRQAHREWGAYLREREGLWLATENELLDYIAGLQGLAIERPSIERPPRVSYNGPESGWAAIRERGILLVAGGRQARVTAPEAVLR